MNVDSWLEKKFQGEFFSGKFDHLKELIGKLELDKIAAKVITIAGTNGKGETSRCLAKQLELNNKNYSLWTSPHLFSVVERFHFNGHVISNNELLDGFNWVETNSKDYKLSYFEFLFVCFLYLTKKKNVDYVILEVGLGGRLDAANTIQNDLVLLTSISRDHQAFLGRTYRKILKEKLGVCHPRGNLFSSLELSYLRDLVAKDSLDRNYMWKDLYNSIDGFSDFDFSKRNQHLAKEAIKFLSLNYKETHHSSAIRLQQTYIQSELLYYSSHNPDGIRKLVQHLDQVKYNNFNYIILSFSERDLNDLRTMVAILRLKFGKIPMLFYQFEFEKMIGKEKLASIKDDFNLEIINQENIFQRIDFNKKNSILCTGSQYFFSHIYKTIESIK